MKRIFAGFVAILVAMPLIASAQTTRPADRPARDTNVDRPAWKHAAGVYEANDIIGTGIKNAEGKDIGEIDQLLVDSKTGKVSHVVIGVGGVAGVAEKKVVVPWSDLKFAAGAGKRNAITMDPVKLERAPRYERSTRSDAPPAASPRTSDPSGRDTDKDGKSNRTDKAPVDPTRK
jgi:sporulation protein YlmC with PRC-barrel domain